MGGWELEQIDAQIRESILGFGHIDLGSKRPDVCAGWATWAECQRRAVEGINGAYQLPMVMWL